MKEVYQYSKEELYERYGRMEGLKEEQVCQLLVEHGENILEESGRKSVLQIFLEQFADLLVAILIVASIISMLSGNVESTIVIIAVIILNAILGTVQYVKAEKSLDSLKELSAPKAKVFRDGVRKEVAAREIVPGDLMILEAGDMVVADGRILENYSLQVNESALTGESTNVEKTEMEILEVVGLADRTNMVYSGSLVTYGRAKVLVTGTGMNTEMGKIAKLMNDMKEKKTPLQVSLDDFSKKLAIVIIMISIVVFGLRIYQGEEVLDSLMFAVALAVAAIPEALGSIVTIVQAMGTRRMAADAAIIKDLKAVESLGCVSVICSDKTGTLTQNKMTVRECYLDGRCCQVEGLEDCSNVRKHFLYNMILNNDATIHEGKEIGDPTETCLLRAAEKAGIDSEQVRENYPRIDEIPFDSDRKLMSSKYVIDGISMVYTKGAVDVLLDRIDYIWKKEGVREITEKEKREILKQNQTFSENGLRVLALVCKEYPADENLISEMEFGYTFLGLVSMIDPPREESKQAVAEAIGAGMKPIMITGDHKVTATAIARQIGIYQEGDLSVTGQELDQMSDAELDQVLEQISVYARVSPENKIRIVSAWQEKGKIVAMTGDGVNDAPALKKADIGVAMGITGTEVSKDASAMILADDNFATIIKAVLNGRNVYRNIMNAILFLLSGNLAAIFVVLFCSIMALSTPFEPVHLLFINLVTDSLPALAIGMEPLEKNLLKERPRDPKIGIFTRDFSARLLGYGMLIAVVTQIAYYQGLQVSPATASTMAFAVLTLARLFHGFTCRSKKSIFAIKFTSNWWSIGAFCVGTLFLAIVLFVPALEELFVVAPLSGTQIGWVTILAMAPTVCVQVGRMIKEKIMI